MTSRQSDLLASLLADQTLAIVGAAGGDEGKGKIVDAVSPYYAAAVRYSGGANAGHTVYTVDGRKVVGHLIPCGLAKGITCVIARGVFFDAARFLSERDAATGVLGGSCPGILVDFDCTLWTPYHSLVEGWCESKRGAERIGTTGRGIGPLAAIRDLRLDIKAADLLLTEKELCEKVTLIYRTFEPILALIANVPAPCKVAADLHCLSAEIAPHLADTRSYLYKLYKDGRKILFEGSQALMLDLMAGTTPYVSSGMSTAAGVAVGTCLPYDVVKSVGMVAKILPTRVGIGGPMPSEFGDRAAAEQFPKDHPELFEPGCKRDEALDNLRVLINSRGAKPEDYGTYFQILGDERGASTGRGRSVGRTDLPWLEYANQVNAPKFMALTRFDMLSGITHVPVVTDYVHKGRKLPAGQMLRTAQLAEVETVVENWPCWNEDISGMTQESQLPLNARVFLDRMERRLNVHIALVGTGPKPQDIIVRERSD